MCRKIQIIVLIQWVLWATACGSVTPDPPECDTASDCVAGNNQCGVGSCIEGTCLFTPDETCCGNGHVDEGEDCDDGNLLNGDDCPSTCSNALCGDGLVEGPEECDAGDDNANAPNAPCRIDCSLPICGDGFLDSDAGEECDDGNTVDTDACLTSCTLAICGDGIVQSEAEACDLGEENSDEPGAACRGNCQEAGCGDGILDPDSGEACDDANDIDTDACLSTCVEASCGDGLVHEGVEACDQGEGNSDEPNAGCRTDCQEARCGDGITDNSLNEECDDGNDDNTDGCVEGCVPAICGDTFVQQGVEECDDGNDSNTDECVVECKIAVCGDAYLHEGVEECDLGEVNNSDLSNSNCRTTCVLPFCGDGITDDLAPYNEDCDDGNNENNDGCVEGCTPAVCGDGFVRTAGAPGELEECDEGAANSDVPDSVCRPTCVLPHCGDGVVDPGLDEECDDGGVGGGDWDACTNQLCTWQSFKIPMSLSPEARSVAATLDDSGNLGVAWTALAEGTAYRYVYSTRLNPELHPYTVLLGTWQVPMPIGTGIPISTPGTVSVEDTVLITSSASGVVIGWKDFTNEFCLKRLNAPEEEEPSKVVAQTYWDPEWNLTKNMDEMVLGKSSNGQELLVGWTDTGHDECPDFLGEPTINNGICNASYCPNANDCSDCGNCGFGIASVARVSAADLQVLYNQPHQLLASPTTGNVENLGFCTDVQGRVYGVMGTLLDEFGFYDKVYVRDSGVMSVAEGNPLFPVIAQTTFFSDIPTSLTHIKAGRCIKSENKRIILLPTDKLTGDDPIYISYQNNTTEISGVFAFEGPGFSQSGSTLHTIQGSPDSLVAVMTSTVGNGVLELAGSFFVPDDFVGENIDSLTLFDADPSDNTDRVHESATVLVYPDFSRALFVWVQDGEIWGRVHPWGNQ